MERKGLLLQPTFKAAETDFVYNYTSILGHSFLSSRKLSKYSLHLGVWDKSMFWILNPFPSVDTYLPVYPHPPIVFLGYRVVDLWLRSAASVLDRGVGQEIIPAALAPQDGAISQPEIRENCLFEKI